MKTITSFARDKRWVGLIFALISVVLLSMIMTVFYEIVIPRARNVKGIEQSNVAAYNAESGIEASLNSFTGSNPVAVVDTGSIGIYSVSGSIKRECTSAPCVFPEPWKGNSPTGSDYNIIRPGSPIQILFNDNITTFGGLRIEFHMPDAFGWSTRTLKDPSSKEYFIWTFTTNPAAPLVAKSITSQSGELLPIIWWNFSFQIEGNNLAKGIKNDGTKDIWLWSFINSNTSDCSGYKCTLKISLIRDLITDTNVQIPYLEYQITADNLTLPLQYATLTSTGTQGPFSKTVTREVERFTTNEAFDFTVLQ